MVDFEVCKFEKKYFRLKNIFLRLPLPRIPRQVCRVQIWMSWYFFKRDIQPRGKSTAKNAWKYHKLQSSANFFAQRGFMGIFNMSFLIPCWTKWHQKSFDINFFRVQPFSYQPIAVVWDSGNDVPSASQLLTRFPAFAKLANRVNSHPSRWQNYTCVMIHRWYWNVN